MTQRHLGEFENERGEVMREGQFSLGVRPTLPSGIPSRPSPPYPRQVVSGYDARPIGGYDFILTATLDPYPVALTDATVTAPFGFITVLRRIELTAVPALVLTEAWSWRLLVDGIVRPNFEWSHSPELDASQAIDTFQVIPPNTPFGLRCLNDLSSVGDVFILIRFIGNLILDTNIPPTEQVGSLPTQVIVKDDAP